MRSRNKVLVSERDTARLARVSAQYAAQCHRMFGDESPERSRNVVELPCGLAPGVVRRTSLQPR